MQKSQSAETQELKLNSYPRGDKDKGASDHLGGCQKCHLLPSASVIGIVIITIIIVIFIRDSTTTIILIAVICILGFGLKIKSSASSSELSPAILLEHNSSEDGGDHEADTPPGPNEVDRVNAHLRDIQSIMMRAAPTNHAQHVKILSTYINSYLETDIGNGAI